MLHRRWAFGGLSQLKLFTGRICAGAPLGTRGPLRAAALRHKPSRVLRKSACWRSPLSPRCAGGDAEACPCAGRGQRGSAAPTQRRGVSGPARPGSPCMLRRPWELLVPSFLRRQESRRSVGVKGAPNVRWRPIMRGALGALVGRRADGKSSHRWAVAWIPAYAGMTDRAPTAPTELIFNTVALSLRDISPRAAGAEEERTR